jgi:hypothetical protein|eukprot:COSAG01_NODE_2345_length_7860_cov_23.900528_4_plen_41_part_00
MRDRLMRTACKSVTLARAFAVLSLTQFFRIQVDLWTHSSG